ncbi:MAG: hypothetical protein AAGL89_07645 [Pseudomonadota bacterium]
MSSFNRRHALLSLAALAGCGFEPLYGRTGQAEALRGRIAFQAPQTVEGFRLRARLEDRLGRTERGAYLLRVEMEIEEIALVISSDQDINRFNLPGTARWQLTADEDDAVLASGVAETFTAYSAFGTTVATRESQDDARDRLAIALADLIITDLIIAAGDLP